MFLVNILNDRLKFIDNKEVISVHPFISYFWWGAGTEIKKILCTLFQIIVSQMGEICSLTWKCQLVFQTFTSMEYHTRGRQLYHGVINN